MIGQKIIRLYLTDSTNAHLQRLSAKENIPEGTVATASFQTEGRGQQGTQWKSHVDSNLLLSVFLRPEFLAPDNQFLLSQTIALAVRETLSELLPKGDVRIKWPNDIYIADKKIAGTLIENALQGNKLKSSIVGIGINVKYVPKDIAAAKMDDYTPGISLPAVEKMLLEKIAHYYQMLSDGQYATIHEGYLQHLYGYGQELHFYNNGNEHSFSGKITGISTDGRLQIESAGRELLFNIKEMSFII